jgi:hypothetical protein
MDQAPPPVPFVVLGRSFEHGGRGWRQRWRRRRLASDGNSGGRGRSRGGKANAQRMHSLLNGVMQERDVIFTWRNRLGYPAHTGLMCLSIYEVRLRLCSNNIVIYATVPQCKSDVTSIILFSDTKPKLEKKFLQPTRSESFFFLSCQTDK